MHTINGNVSLCSGDEVFVQLLQVLRLRNRVAEAVDEDGGGAVGLQQRAQEPLQEGNELLVLLGLAHLCKSRDKIMRRERNRTLTGEPPEEPVKMAVTHCTEQPTAHAHGLCWKWL